MTTVTRDATSGKWLPQSAAEATSLYAGRTVSIPTITALWLCQESSGDLADTTGNGHTLVSNAIGACTYAQSVSGYTTKAVVPTVDDVRIFRDSTWADASATVFAVINFPSGSSSANPHSILTFGATYGSQVAVDDQHGVSPLRLNVVTTGDTMTGGAVNTVGVHPIVLTAKKSTSGAVYQTDLETVTQSTTPANNWGAFTFGGNNSSYWTSSGAGYMHAIGWSGTTAAEFTAAQRAILIDAFNNGPAVTSIAITPSSATIAVAGTQAMTATATRADGSTFDVTATATWTSGTPATATVASTGIVTGVSAGTTSITCTFTSLSASTITSNAATITVSGGGTATITKLTITPSAPAIIVGQSEQASVVATYSDTSTADLSTSAIWTSLSPSTASVGAHGLIVAISPGIASIQATPGNVAYPGTAAAMASAVGYGTWGAGYLCDVTSGSIVPAFGSPSLSAVSSPVYSLPGPLGSGDSSVGFDSAQDGFSGGNVFDVASGDLVFGWVAQFTSTPPNGDLLYKSIGSGQYELRTVAGAYRADLSDGSTNLYAAVSTPAPVGVWHAGMFVIDRGAGTFRIATINLDGTNAAISAAQTLGAIGSITSTAAMFIGSPTSSGFGTGAPTTLNLSACWIGTGSGVAATMSANLAAAVNNLRQALIGTSIVTVVDVVAPPNTNSEDHVAIAVSRLPEQFKFPLVS